MGRGGGSDKEEKPGERGETVETSCQVICQNTDQKLCIFTQVIEEEEEEKGLTKEEKVSSL